MYYNSIKHNRKTTLVSNFVKMFRNISFLLWMGASFLWGIIYFAF